MKKLGKSILALALCATTGLSMMACNGGGATTDDGTTTKIIFRLQNNTSSPVSTHISINGAVRPLSFGKYEVKTVVYENGELTEIAEMII